MQLWAQIWQLVLLPLLLLPASFCSTCPQQCYCSNPGSIFCIQRRASTMPLNLPASTHSLFVFQNGINFLQEKDFHGLVHLEMLDLSQNELSMIPNGVFGALQSLHNLDLSSNKITQISKDSFDGLVNLERLYIHNNRIQSIHPAAFKGLEHLLELKLQGNQISLLPVLHLPKLLLLDLSFNNIPPPEPADLQTPHLESLKLAGLGLTALDEGLLRSLGNLHDLDLSQNKLVRMPPALISAKGITRLNLSNNPLGPLRQEDFKNLVGLQELDLSSLNLQGFPVDFFHVFPKLNHLTTAENPFNCVCSLSWFPNWMKNAKVELGRIEETRCHFPLINAGRMLSELEHKDFGCPTTITELSDVLTSSSRHNTPDPTTTPHTTNNVLPFVPSEESPVEPNQQLPPEASASPRSGKEHKEHMCPPNICLNGGTCKFDQRGEINCLCPVGTMGIYCENQDESQTPPLSPSVSVVTVPLIKPDQISFHHVKSTSISLDLHQYIEARPNIRGIRLTYRNLSGPDRRPLQLNVPASYPEYTLRGLQPNCTYSICASPLDEPVEETTHTCMEAKTAGVSLQPTVDRPEHFPFLVPILGAVAVAMTVVIVAAVAVVLRRKRVKCPTDMDLGEPTPFELEGVKMGLENGTAHQKQTEISPYLPASQNSMDYEVPLISEQFASNNNTDQRIPSYF
ncbi:vasorin a [Silurus meridionalis]|nr:vasorin a [Silurus meridionalis]XP_046696596.1 vasorin a [Silurus meridionalis]XP_046696597.1 vasorin a [Silurus meridionalis]XP_046696598.1 vasorin a [Silurus meridionalis]KAI5088903.1 vasorin a precursor [Silurus meridionalis]